METTTRSQLYNKRKDRLTFKIHGRSPRPVREPGKNLVKKKTTYRVKARDQKQQLVFFKTRTADRLRTVRRFATLQGWNPERIKI